MLIPYDPSRAHVGAQLGRAAATIPRKRGRAVSATIPPSRGRAARSGGDYHPAQSWARSSVGPAATIPRKRVAR